MTDIVFSHEATTFAGVCACIFSVVGILGNLITILALVRCPKMRGHAVTAFVFSLCISDLLFCSFSLPLTAVRYFNEAWTLGDTLCKIFPVIFYGNVAVSLLSMVGITINRYIIIACQSIYARVYSKLFIYIQIVSVWLISFSLMLPPLLGVWGELGLDEATFSCTILKKDGKSIKKLLFLISFVLPCVVIVCCYTCIYIVVQRQKKKMEAHRLVLKTKEAERSAKNEREDRRLTSMMLLIFVCFFLCFFPLMIANVVDEHNSSMPWLHILASVLAWASSVINPFIYAVSNRSYRVAYYRVFAMFKFWGEPLVVNSRSIQPSKNNSKNQSDAMRSAALPESVDERRQCFIQTKSNLIPKSIIV